MFWPNTSQFSKRSKIITIYIVLLPGVLFSIVSILLLLYTFLPRPLTLPPVKTGKNMTILVHGIYDTPKTWSKTLAELLEDQDSSRQATPLNWNRYAQSSFRCSVDGLRLGKKLAQALTENNELQSLHLIGHSCGAFVIYGICKGVKESSKAPVIQTTYLDPVSIYGGVFRNFGINNFGSCADFSEAYIDIGDNVPGSNQLLPHTHTFDTTAIRLQKNVKVSPHLWPTVYYTELSRSGRQPLLIRDKNIRQHLPPNTLEKVVNTHITF